MSETPTSSDGDVHHHPRDTQNLFGHAEAEQTLLDAFNTSRMHHGWLLTGPKGVGKATLAWKMARFMLATPDPQEDGGLFGGPEPASTLDIDPEHPVARRIASGAESGLISVTCTPNEQGRMRQNIVVEDIRRISGFFQLSAADGGRRIVIVDAADDMNVSAANALLKMLEEPPERTTLFLVSHQPSRLLPTIRSRCRTLRLHPLLPDDLSRALDQFGIAPEAPEVLGALAAGSVGEAVRLEMLEGRALYTTLVRLLGTLPRLDHGAALKLAEAAAARGAEQKLELFYTLLETAMSRLVRQGATGHSAPVMAAPDEAQIFARLAPNPASARDWANAAETAFARARHGRAVNLDPAALVLDTLFKLKDAAPA